MTAFDIDSFMRMKANDCKWPNIETEEHYVFISSNFSQLCISPMRPLSTYSSQILCNVYEGQKVNLEQREVH